MKKILLVLILIMTGGIIECAMPSTTVRTIDDRPALIFKGAPGNAVLFLDGINLGSASQYDGEPRALNVEPGTHHVQIIINNATVYDQKVFVEGALKTIIVH